MRCPTARLTLKFDFIPMHKIARKYAQYGHILRVDNVKLMNLLNKFMQWNFRKMLGEFLIF